MASSQLSQLDSEKEKELTEAEEEVEETPATETCLRCTVAFKKNDKCVQCAMCELWAHTKCTELSTDSMKALNSRKKDEGLTWQCRSCLRYTHKFLAAARQMESRLTSLEKKVEVVAVLEAAVGDLQKEFVVMKENLATRPVNSSSSEDVFSELRERELRKENIIVQDLPEPTGSTGWERSENDARRLTDVLWNIGVELHRSDIKFMTRVGKFQEGKTRPLLVGIVEQRVRDAILSNAPKLNKLQEPMRKISIVKDLTKKQREEEVNLAKEAVDRNSKLSEQDRKNFQWKVTGKRGERRLVRARVPPPPRPGDGDQEYTAPREEGWQQQPRPGSRRSRSPPRGGRGQPRPREGPASGGRGQPQPREGPPQYSQGRGWRE